ncbi:unnamed protein product [Allacma fusca]|uniref:Peptidase aspartic putative domain-containing protein n=1 Tax=Allacma fusca TaxID=39272 RepID=A0A8J2J3R3_9HEXA|nr:unnamed protein product [Allacma fusca]
MGNVQVGKGSAVAVNTTLGWIIIGPTCNSTECQHTSSFVIQDTLDAKLQRLWELEEQKGKSTFTLEEVECQEHFSRTHTRKHGGRYIVQLPFQNSHKPLGESRTKALQDSCLKRRG